MIKVDELLVERIFKAIKRCSSEKAMLETVYELNKESLVRKANNSTSNYNVFRHKNWVFMIDTMRGSIMLLDEVDIAFISQFGMPTVKGTKYVNKFVTRGTVTHAVIATYYGVVLDGRETPIHHINGYAFDNRKKNLIVCEGTISHAYLHSKAGQMINNSLKGNLDMFSIVGKHYWLNGVAYKIPGKDI